MNGCENMEQPKTYTIRLIRGGQDAAAPMKNLTWGEVADVLHGLGAAIIRARDDVYTVDVQGGFSVEVAAVCR